VHWTESLKKALNYNPQTAAVVDNGNAQSFLLVTALCSIYIACMFVEVPRNLSRSIVVGCRSSWISSSL